MSIRGKGDYRKRIVCYLPPKLAKMADHLARHRLMNVSAIIRSLLFDEVSRAAASGELVIDLSSTNTVKGGFRGQQMSIDELLEKLEGGEISWSDPQVMEFLEQNGYTLEQQATEQGLALSS